MSGYIIILIAAISMLVSGTGTYIFKNDVDKIRLEKAVDDQKNADTTSCNADKKITEDADAKIQNDNAVLNKRLHALRLRPAQCVPIITDTTSAASAKTKSGQVGANAGISTTNLIEYAGECEQDRLQLNDLIDFVNSVWSRK